MPYAFTNGAGTEADPYQVWTAADLNGVRDYPSSHFIQMKHIDLSVYLDWSPIGNVNIEEMNYDPAFSGSYDGNGYKISNLTVLTEYGHISRPEQYCSRGNDTKYCRCSRRVCDERYCTDTHQKNINCSGLK